MFDWSEYLHYATSLIQLPAPSEAELRSAMSRAYYAAFNTARDFLIRIQRLAPALRRHVHATVWRLLRDSLSPVERGGLRLLDFRKKADYERAYPRVNRDAKTAVLHAGHLVDAINQLSPSNIT
ncbi:hypothetical protein BH09CHL1_BH09CHL1_14760 [soil metagenome]